MSSEDELDFYKNELNKLSHHLFCVIQRREQLQRENNELLKQLKEILITSE